MGDSSTQMDCLAQLELDIKKEQVDLLAQLAQGKNILRQIQTLPFSQISKNPVIRKIKIPLNYSLKSINLLVYGQSFINPNSPLNGIECKLRQILTNYYFEIQFPHTKFSNTETLTTSRLFERYLSGYLSNQSEDIFVGENRMSINIFDFKYAPINFPDMVLELYIQETADPSVSLSLEYIYEKNIIQIPRPFVRPKNGEQIYLQSNCFKICQLIRNSGYSYGLVLCFVPNDSNLTSPLYPSLEKIKIFPSQNLNDGCVEFGPDDFRTFETSVFKYIVLMFDPNYRSDENIQEMLDGYLFDSKKIHGINFYDSTDPAINMCDEEYDEEDDEEDDFTCCEYVLEFNQLDPHDSFIIHENFYYMDCV